MELRSNRSRSKTPLFRTSIGRETIESGNHIGAGETIIRTTRSTTTKTTTTSNSDVDNITNINHNLDIQSQKPFQIKNSKSEKVTRKTRYKTSDYSSEDGEAQVTSTDTAQNSSNEFLEEARRSLSRSSHTSALEFYRAAGDYWNKFPKTDYTYSPHSKDRTEIAPGVVAMPNMSRRSLHSYDLRTDYVVANKQTNTVEQDEVDYALNSDYNCKVSSNYNSGDSVGLRPRNLFYNNNYDDKYTYSASKSLTVRKRTFISTIITTITSVFITILTWISSPAYYLYNKQNSGIMWIGKKIHTIATRLMLWDTWLLVSSSRKRKISSLLVLCLIPLLLLGGWWLLPGLSRLLHGFFNTTTSLLPSASIVGTTTDEIHEDKILAFDHPDTEETSTSTNDNVYKQTILEEKIIREKIILEPPKANEIAAELSSRQLQEIADSIKRTLEMENQYTSEIITEKILQNPNIQAVINNYHKLAIKLEGGSEKAEKFASEDITEQQLVIDSLREEISKVKVELLQLEQKRNEEMASIIAQMRSENAQNNARLSYQVNRCCRRSFIHIESYITKILKDLLGAPQYLSTPKDISNWLHSTFVAKQDLETRLTNLTQHLKSDYDTLIENNGLLIMDKVISKISAELNSRIEKVKIQNQEIPGTPGIDSLTDEHIRKIVKQSLAIYDADKTGLVDYALESAGGQVLSTRCTESYQARTAVVSIFGVPLWYPSNTPRTVITPGVVPGECWAFQNFPGFLLIKLAAPVKIEAFSVEHISKMLAPNGKVDSAPKEFSVYGLRNETDKEPLLLGQYMYDSDGPPLQYFAASVHGLVFNIVELRIHSNHGNPNYTCLYRFRVHGSLSAESA